jgi:hypothetical protein
MTKEAKDRKKRTVEKVPYKERITLLILNLYISALVLLKEFVFLLQEPMLYKLHDQQAALIRKFLYYFSKPEMVSGVSITDILKLDFSKADLYLPRQEMHISWASCGELIQHHG